MAASAILNLLPVTIFVIWSSLGINVKKSNVLNTLVTMTMTSDVENSKN